MAIDKRIKLEVNADLYKKKIPGLVGIVTASNIINGNDNIKTNENIIEKIIEYDKTITKEFASILSLIALTTAEAIITDNTDPINYDKIIEFINKGLTAGRLIEIDTADTAETAAATAAVRRRTVASGLTDSSKVIENIRNNVLPYYLLLYKETAQELLNFSDSYYRFIKNSYSGIRTLKKLLE
jgi:transcription initiation factor TFIIIB Brf1 subunit/transcription initiation factor TFIIB